MPDEGGSGEGVLVPEPSLQDGPEILYMKEIQKHFVIDKPESKFST